MKNHRYCLNRNFCIPCCFVMTSGYDYDIGYVKIFKTPLSLRKKNRHTGNPSTSLLPVNRIRDVVNLSYILYLCYIRTHAHTQTHEWIVSISHLNIQLNRSNILKGYRLLILIIYLYNVKFWLFRHICICFVSVGIFEGFFSSVISDHKSVNNQWRTRS